MVIAEYQFTRLFQRTLFDFYAGVVLTGEHRSLIYGFCQRIGAVLIFGDMALSSTKVIYRFCHAHLAVLDRDRRTFCRLKRNDNAIRHAKSLGEGYSQCHRPNA